MISTYYFLKLCVFFSLVRTLVRFEPMKDHVLSLAGLYTGGVAVLSYVFLIGPQDRPDVRAWEFWLGQTFVIALVYFWLINKFVEGALFWVLLLAGFAVVLY